MAPEPIRNPSERGVTDEQLEGLIREVVSRSYPLPSLTDPEAFVRRCRELARPKPPPRRRNSFAYSLLAASVLIAAGVALYFAVRPANDADRVAAPVAFSPGERRTGVSGTDPVRPNDRSVTLTIPGLDLSANAGRGRVVTVEFHDGDRPRVWPAVDAACPQVPHDDALGEYPFTRPLAGRKWVIVAVTDRPAAEALTGRVASGPSLDPDGTPEAATATVVAALRQAGFRVLAVGCRTLTPSSP